MEIFIYISVFILYIACGYLIYKNIQFKRALGEQDRLQKKALVEAGNAITDTLRVAFDNIKRHGSEMNKLENKHTEYQSRFHRLEQSLQQLISKASKNILTEQTEEKKNEKRNSKTN